MAVVLTTYYATDGFEGATLPADSTDDGTQYVPKHVADILKSDIYTCFCKKGLLRKLIIVCDARYIEYK